MASKQIRADLNFAFPTAEIAVMGSQGAVEILYRKELAEASKPDEFKKKKVEGSQASSYNNKPSTEVAAEA